MPIDLRFALFFPLVLSACTSQVFVDPRPDGAGGETGGSTTTIITDPPPPPPPCTADVASDPLNCGACGHDCLGGACVAGACQPIELAKQGGQPWEITLDADHVYWNNTHCEISKVPKNGGAVQILTEELINAGALAVRGGRVYSASSGGAVRYVSTAGGPLSSLTAPVGGGFAVATDQSFVYWSSSAPSPGADTLVKTDFAGKETSVVGEPSAGMTSIAVDATHAYWTRYSGDAASGAVLRVPLSGGATVALAWGTGFIQLAIDGDDIYWLSDGTSENSWTDGALYTVKKSGGEPTQLATSLHGATRLAVDATHVYWTEAYGMLIRKVPRSGGDAVTLATSDGNPQGIAVDDHAVYWVDPGNGRIMKVAK